MENIAKRIDSSMQITSFYIEKVGKQKELVKIKQLLNKATDTKINVLVCGEFKRGKSSFINAFLDEPLCSVDVDICTSVVSIIQYGPKVKVVRSYGELSDLKTKEVPFKDIVKYSVGDAKTIDNTVLLTIEVPNERLRNITLIDTPGVGGLDKRHAFLTTTFMSMANIVLFMTDVNEPMTTTELSFYKEKTKYVRQRLILLNKSDLKTKEEVNQLITDTTYKVATECKITANEVKVISISAAHKISYNKNRIDKKLKSSNFEELESELKKSVTLHKKEILSEARNLYISVLDSLIAPLKFQLQQIKQPDTKQIIQLKTKENELSEQLSQLHNPSSVLRTRLQNYVSQVRGEINDYLTEQTVLFSSEGLNSLLLCPEAKADDGYLWIAQQLNLAIESLGAEVVMKLRDAFRKICSQKEIEGLFQYHIQDFYYQVEAREAVGKDLTFTDKMKHVLPGAGIGGLALTVVSTFLSGGLALVGAAGAIALGYKTTAKSINDASIAQFTNSMKSVYGPQVSIAVQKLNNYVNSQIQEFYTNLLSSITQKVESSKKDLVDLQTNLKILSQNAQNAKKRKAEIDQILLPLETQRKTVVILLSDPLSSKKTKIKEVDPHETICE